MYECANFSLFFKGWMEDARSRNDQRIRSSGYPFRRSYAVWHSQYDRRTDHTHTVPLQVCTSLNGPTDPYHGSRSPRVGPLQTFPSRIPLGSAKRASFWAALFMASSFS